MTNYGHIWHSIANSDQFSRSATEKPTNDLWRQLVAYTAKYGIYWSRMTCCRQWWPTMLKNIKFERVNPLQGRIEGRRSSISGYSMYGYSETRFVILAPRWHMIVQYLLQRRDMIDRGHIGPCIIFFEQFCHFLSGLIILRSKRQVSAKVGRNGPQSYKMSCHSEVWPTASTFNSA